MNLPEALKRCPSISQHTQAPTGYTNWHTWANDMKKGHYQTQCPDCKAWVIWEAKNGKNDKLAVQKCGNCRAYPCFKSPCNGEFRSESDWCDKWTDKTPETCGNCEGSRRMFRGAGGRLWCGNKDSTEYGITKIGGETCNEYRRYRRPLF